MSEARNWRDHLETWEGHAITHLERKINTLDLERADLAKRRKKIVDRASARARAAGNLERRRKRAVSAADARIVL